MEESILQISGREKLKMKHLESRLEDYLSLLTTYSNQIPDGDVIHGKYGETHKISKAWWFKLVSLVALDKRFGLLDESVEEDADKFLERYGDQHSLENGLLKRVSKVQIDDADNMIKKIIKDKFTNIELQKPNHK